MQHRSTKLTKGFLASLTLAASLGTAHALPEVKVGTGFLISPTDANTYYNAQGMTSPAWTEDPEINKLAAALGDDADRIYEYVRNEIDVIPLFGVHAGARGCYIDKACTPFDQAEFMVELLRSAGYTAKYQLGTITLTGAQFNDWVGITNATAARKLLADGGTPATVSDNGTAVTSVTMMHVWVIATIGGTGYAFDPAFKPHTAVAGIDVGTTMGFNASTFWSNAIQGAVTSGDAVHSLNRTNIRNDIANYAITLLNHIKNNMPNAAIEDVIGGKNLIPYTGAAVRQTSLPHQASTTSQFTGDLPLALRSRVSFAFGSGAQAQTVTWNLSDIYGKQLVSEANDDNPQAGVAHYRFLLGEQDISGWLDGAVSAGTVTINHPYASGTSSGVVNGAYMDRSVPLSGGVPYGAIQIFIAPGGVSNEFGAYQERTHSGRGGRIVFHRGCCPEPPGDQWVVPQQIAQKRRLGAAFLSQFMDMTELVGGVGNAVVLVHDVVGATGGAWSLSSDQEDPVDSSYALSMEPSISAISKTGDTAQTQAIARTVAIMTSALEGSAAQQVMDSVYPVSAVAQLDWAHAGPTAGNRWYYYATSSNWVSSVKSQILLDYGITPQETGRSPILGVAESYINAGWNVIIPKSSSLGPAPAIRQHCIPWDEPNPILGGVTHHFCIVVGPDRAGALIAFNPTTGAIAHISARDNVFGKGGGGSSDVETNPTKVFSIAEDFLDKQYTSRAAAHNVDLKSGAMTYTAPPDVKVGSGEYPYSLSFQRSYRYGFNADEDHYSLQHPLDTHAPQKTWARDPLFGASGWTSNLQHTASVSSDGSQVFGRDDPRIAAQTIATVKALLSIMGDGANNLETLERQIVGAYAAFWWTQSIETNTLTVKQGHSSRTFTRLADGAYVARGSAETAVVQGARYPVTTAIAAKRGGESVWWYSMCATVTGAQREITVYNGASCNQTPPSVVSDYPNETRGGTLTFVSQTFPFGITVTYNAATGTLSNNLGRWIKMNGVFGGNINGDTSYGTGGTVTHSANATTVTFAQPQPGDGYASALTVTDLAGKTWTYAEDTARTWFEVRPPSTPSLYWLRYEYAAGSYGTVDRIKDAIGNTTTYNIGGGRAASVVDPLGNTTRTMHDRFGNVVKIVDPLGRTATTEYDNYRRKVKSVAPEGNFATFTYDARSNVLTEVQHVKPGSSTTPTSRTVSTKTYDALCNVALTDTDALTRTTTTAINQTTCKVTSVTAPDGGVTTFAYNSHGQVTQKTDPTGLVTQMTYNTPSGCGSNCTPNGNLESVIVNPGGLAITTLFGYDAIGNITSVTDPRGYQHTGTYDAMRRLTQYNAPAGTNAATKWTYDVDGLVTKIERAANPANTVWATTQYAYYATGRVASVTDADGRVTRYTYDAANRLSFTIDPVARQTKKIYDAASQVIEERRGVGSPDEQAYSKFAYTLNGKQAWIKDAKNNQTTYDYDGYDRLEKTTFPDATFETLAYTLTDKVASKLTRGNQLIQNSYDVLDREISHLVPQPTGPAITTSTSYDPAGRVTAKSDTAGHSLTYGFDTAKRPISVTQAAPTFAGTRVVSYLLDLAGNKTRTTWADGYYVTYAYDALNRMTTATENGTFLLSTYIYDTLSRRTSLVYGNGAAQGYTYSTQGDLLTLASTLTATSNTYTNTFTPAHQLMSEAASNAAWAYVPAALQTTNYAAANALNQYVNITVGANPTVTMAYDANGNLTGDGVWTFAYDAQNMLRSAVSAASTSTYQYDPLGRRQMLTEGGVTTTFLHDGDEEIADYAAADVLRRYVPGPGTDMPIAMVTPSGGSNTRKYFHTNRQGSTIAMSADDGTMSEGPYTYDAYGNGAPATGVPFKYTGRRLDAGTGLYYYRARYYSVALGRFLQVDPVGYEVHLNLYAYVGNDPLNKNDPLGLYDATPCEVGDQQCAAAAVEFETQRQQNLNSKHKEVADAARAFGDPGDGNGVQVTFKSQAEVDKEAGVGRGNHAPAATTPGVRFGPNGTKTEIKVSVSKEIRGSDMARAVAHEGVHVSDAQKFIASFDPKTGKFAASANYSRRDTEMRAYRVGNMVKPYVPGMKEPQLLEVIGKMFPDDPVWDPSVTQ